MNIKLQIVDNKAFRQNSLIYPLYTTHYSKILDIQTKNLHLTVKKNNYFFIFNLQSACAFSSASSLLLDNGVAMKQIQEWLGHSDFSTTANIYAHLEYKSKVNSANAMLNGLGLASE